MPNKINILDEDLIGKIAAGEVVERPASAVKELIENSLDADASHIKVDFHQFGTKYIKVSDNGSGMSAEDAELSIRRHSTSKISTVRDLSNIYTFGFRGEALSSISSVSKMTITTKTAEMDTAFSIKVEGGNISSREAVSRSRGTTVEISDLFYNTPARHKFLKSKQTERNHIISAFEEIALANPDIGFELYDENGSIYQLAPTNKPLERITDILGRDMSAYFMPVDVEHSLVKISGFITRPLYRQNTRTKNYLFVNRRPVVSRILNFAISDAYRPYLPQGNYPICVLFIEIDYDLVDVNVHPAKREIRLSKERQIFALLKDGITQNIQKSIMPELENVRSDSDMPRPKDMPNDPLSLRQKIAVEKSIYKYFSRDKGVETGRKFAPEKNIFQNDFQRKPSEGMSKTATETWDEVEMDLPMNLSDIRVIGQFNKLYIVAEWGDNLVIIDQHAAEERVLFEAFLKQTETGSVESQELLVPYTFELPQSEYELLQKFIPELSKIRVEIEQFGEKGFLLRSLPAAFKKMDAFQSFISQIIEQLIFFDEGAGAEISVIPQIRENLIRAACAAAVKANQELSFEEIKSLTGNLSKCSNPYFCPHGRPIITRINSDELKKRFERK